MFASCFWNLLLGRRTSKLSDWRLSSWWPELCWWWVASEAAAMYDRTIQSDLMFEQVKVNGNNERFDGACSSKAVLVSVVLSDFISLSASSDDSLIHWAVWLQILIITELFTLPLCVCVCVWGNHRDWNALGETLILSVLWVFLSALSRSDSTSRCSSYQSWMWLHMITNHSSNTHMLCSTSVSFG